MVRVLYSFANRIGAQRICTTAWHQVADSARAGAGITLHSGAVARPLPDSVQVRTTLSLLGGRVFLYRVLGRHLACRWHDHKTARWLKSHASEVDVVHAWPLASLTTIRTANQLGIPVVLERINAHTRFAYEVVREECRKVGVPLPADHDHEFNPTSLAREEAEYEGADYLLCPSDFVRRTFIDQGFPESKLLRHQYGFDAERFHPGNQNAGDGGLTAIYAGVCEPRKGLHHALEAWLASGAQEQGKFLICGSFIPGYAEKLSVMLAHPSVEVLGHRSDLPELFRRSDLFILPSVEEGSALVTYEARGSGCVLAVSDATGAVCEHMEDGLVHAAGDVKALTDHIRMVDQDRALLGRLRDASVAGISGLTWEAAGVRLHDLYQQVAGRGEVQPQIPLSGTVSTTDLHR